MTRKTLETMTMQEIVDRMPHLKARQIELRQQFASINSLFDKIDNALKADDIETALKVTDQIFEPLVANMPDETVEPKSPARARIAAQIKPFSS